MRHVTIKLCTHLCRRHTCYLVIVYVMHKCVVSRVKSCSHVYITKCCSMLQCVLAWTRLCHLRVLFGICVYEYRKWMSRCAAVCCSVLQRVAFCRSVLQCVAVCCSALQCVAQRICPYRIWMGHFAYQGVTTRVKASCQVWNYQEYQCAAVCCSVLQCVLQCVPVGWNLLYSIACRCELKKRRIPQKRRIRGEFFIRGEFLKRGEFLTRGELEENSWKEEIFSKEDSS